jgi:DNA-binding TFAR19-related protein (PDSD5 family)
MERRILLHAPAGKAIVLLAATTGMGWRAQSEVFYPRIRRRAREGLEEDLDLKIIERRKLEEMKRRIKSSTAPPRTERTDREVVEDVLYDRGSEVLEAAYAYYPKETERLVKELAALAKSGRFVEKVSGGELYSIMRQLGLRFNLKTTIKVQDRGKLVDLSEKLKTKEEG